MSSSSGLDQKKMKVTTGRETKKKLFQVKIKNKQPDKSGAGTEAIAYRLRPRPAKKVATLPEKRSRPSKRPNYVVTRQDQIAFVAMSFSAGITPDCIKKDCDKALGPNAFTKEYIYRLCREFRDGTRTNTEDRSPESSPQTAVDNE